MKLFINIFLFSTTLIYFSCNSSFLKPREFEKEFKEFVLDSDSVMFDGDGLHPTYAFMKNGKIKGLEFNANPECGSYVRRFFLDEDENIKKIIIEKDYWTEHCGNPFDSIYVIKIPSNEIYIYTKETNGKLVKDLNKVENELIDIQKYKNEIKNWHYR